MNGDDLLEIVIECESSVALFEYIFGYAGFVNSTELDFVSQNLDSTIRTMNNKVNDIWEEVQSLKSGFSVSDTLDIIDTLENDPISDDPDVQDLIDELKQAVEDGDNSEIERITNELKALIESLNPTNVTDIIQHLEEITNIINTPINVEVCKDTIREMVLEVLNELPNPGNSATTSYVDDKVDALRQEILVDWDMSVFDPSDIRDQLDALNELVTNSGVSDIINLYQIEQKFEELQQTVVEADIDSLVQRIDEMQQLIDDMSLVEINDVKVLLDDLGAQLGSVDVSHLASKQYVDDKIDSLDLSDVNIDTSNLATKQYVDDEIEVLDGKLNDLKTKVDEFKYADDIEIDTFIANMFT